MESIVRQIKELYAESDPEGRERIHRDIRRLQGSLYSEMEFMIDLAANGPVKYSMTKIGVDLHIFEALHEGDEPLTGSKLAERTAAAPELIRRILRTQAALGLIDQVGADSFQSNRLTGFLANSALTSLLLFQQPVFGPAYQALPDFLRARNYQQVVSEDDTAFQVGHRTNLTFPEFLKQHPEHLHNLHKSMQLSYGNQWIDRFPVEKELSQFVTDSNERPVLVDIGGAHGQQARVFRQRFPSVPGRIIVQDRAEVIENVADIDGVEFMVHDFLQPQPIRGAKFYYLRFVLHDWPDEMCVKILQSIIPAMAPESRIILDELIPSDLGMSHWAAVMDTAMLATSGGSERSRGDWVVLLDRAGLQMLDLLEYDPQNLSVIVAVPKEQKE
ncbi:S-adenosyl-L-methionine-dependent methyltransferase [Aspergillus steynii IBT 23096]|uniref:S-adenosyl-L-methionine-dependent methyltransferase n=1 Tax=Aspergillus steynii IBT 23096 TaxID=1392250 RepID=A0A2I2GL20_9EURO|nr:S-adenosyl-L-methionine-dependent methyltransferase [Aspergillus steynii IBT 23096]PLB53583.1 S-adenosyl-L-methionine-dependent methyltransferase [Aspergillus steynii IBT 23096]